MKTKLLSKQLKDNDQEKYSLELNFKKISKTLSVQGSKSIV